MKMKSLNSDFKEINLRLELKESSRDLDENYMLEASWE